jgi:F-type H+-transporting ATPase subunit b
MKIDLSVIITTILNVFILYWFLRRFLFKPVTGFMEKRTQSIETSIADAESNLKSSEEMKAEYESRLRTADEEGKQIVDEYRSKAHSRSEDIVGEAKKEADLIRRRAELDAQREMERAREDIRRQVIDLSMMAAARSIEGQLDERRHHELIRDFIDKVGV